MCREAIVLFLFCEGQGGTSTLLLPWMLLSSLCTFTLVEDSFGTSAVPCGDLPYSSLSIVINIKSRCCWLGFDFLWPCTVLALLRKSALEMCFEWVNVRMGTLICRLFIYHYTSLVYQMLVYWLPAKMCRPWWREAWRGPYRRQTLLLGTLIAKGAREGREKN